MLSRIEKQDGRTVVNERLKTADAVHAFVVDSVGGIPVEIGGDSLTLKNGERTVCYAGSPPDVADLRRRFHLRT